MEGILVLVIIFGGFFFVGWLFNTISDWFKKHNEEIRDQVAGEVLTGMEIDKVVDQYKNKLNKIEYILKSEQDSKRLEDYLYSQVPKYYRLLGKCPKCNEGSLTKRKGQFGVFIGCSKYPKCDYRTSVKNLKREFGYKTQEV